LAIGLASKRVQTGELLLKLSGCQISELVDGQGEGHILLGVMSCDGIEVLREDGEALEKV